MRTITSHGSLAGRRGEPSCKPIKAIATMRQCCEAFLPHARCAVVSPLDGHIVALLVLSLSPSLSPSLHPSLSPSFHSSLHLQVYEKGECSGSRCGAAARRQAAQWQAAQWRAARNARSHARSHTSSSSLARTFTVDVVLDVELAVSSRKSHCACASSPQDPWVS